MQEHSLWLVYALGNLEAAKSIYDNNAIIIPGFFEAHACAEKSLKAFLVYHQRAIPRIHDLKALNKDCSQIDPQFSELKEEAASLNHYSIKFRYPDTGLPFPFKDTLKTVIKEAEQVYRFVEDRLYELESLKRTKRKKHAKRSSTSTSVRIVKTKKTRISTKKKIAR